MAKSRRAKNYKYKSAYANEVLENLKKFISIIPFKNTSKFIFYGFQFLASVVTVIGVIIIVLNFTDFFNLYKRTVKSNDYWQQVINDLNVQADIGIYKDKLGAPTIINNQGDTVGYVFIKPKFYIDAVSDANGKVLIYSVTTRTKDFTPSIGKFIYKVQLGKTKFNEVRGLPFAVGAEMGFHNFYYEELYYYGNPGEYLTYDYSINDSGYQNYNREMADKLGVNHRELDDVAKANCSGGESNIYYDFPTLSRINDGVSNKVKEKNWVAFRKSAVINTVSIITDHPRFICDFLSKNPNADLPLIGPDINQVRLFN